MAFGIDIVDRMQPIGGGETLGFFGLDLTGNDYETGLHVGRFAKWDNDRVEILDGSATPKIVGVVTRNLTGCIERGGRMTGEVYWEKADFRRKGVVTVDVVAGQAEPAKFAKIYAVNATGADAGKATATSGGNTVDANAEFIRAESPTVWLVNLL